MRTIILDGQNYTVFNENEMNAAKEAASHGANVLIARKCAEPTCNDMLLGSIDFKGSPRCEDENHNTRPGVSY